MLYGCGGLATAGIHARLAWSEQRGLRIVAVPESGPAAEAGLRTGDRVLAIDDEDVASLTMGETVERLRGAPGSEVRLEVVRDRERQEIVVTRARYQR